MDLERAAVAAMQALIRNSQNETEVDMTNLARLAVSYAKQLQLMLEADAEEEGAYETYKSRIPTDDKLWQTGTSEGD